MANERARVGIVGAGTMGAGIAQVALEGGWTVALHDPIAGAFDRGRDRVRDGLQRRAAKVAPESAGAWAAERLERLAVAATLEDLAASQLVIEAALEQLELKRRIFATLDAAADPGVVLATNTSALAVSDIASGTLHPDRIVGLHFFNPAPVLPLVEVVAGRQSADWAVERASGVVEGWGKSPIRVADVPGFIVNRVNRPFTLEPLRLLHAGMGSVESIDGALTAAGFPMGPFALMDLIGIDVNLAAARGLFEASGRPPRFRPSPIQEELVAANRLGRKSGEGFYRYDGNGRATGPAGRFAGTIRLGPSAPKPLDPDSISERVLLAIVNEAYRALGDRVATANDIDRAMRLGANHPFGPFEWARRTGVQEVALMLDALGDEDADTFQPSLPLLREARSAT